MILSTLLFLLSLGGPPQQDVRSAIASLEPEPAAAAFNGDWLVTDVDRSARAFRGSSADELVLSNGLVRRTFRLAPDVATVAYDNLMTGESLLRAVTPEARMTIDGTEYSIGGLRGQKEHGYLRSEWLDEMEANPGGFRFSHFELGRSKLPFGWKRWRNSEDREWPPPGVRLTLHFTPPEGVPDGTELAIHYELYDGIPLIAKDLTLANNAKSEVVIDRFTADILAAVEPESDVESPFRWEFPNIHVETDYSFGGFTPKSTQAVARWIPDPEYTSQVNYKRQTPNLLIVEPPLGPAFRVAPQTSFESFRTYHLVHDSTERERRGLAQRRMYRTIAPWVTENPILMHVRSADPDAVRLAVDQCAEVGFEMVILTFGSGFNIENPDPEYIASMKALADYAHSKGIELGGYSLLASRSIDPETDVVNPETGKPGGFAKFGNSPCLCSDWGQEYFRKLYAFYEDTGFDLLEHDGNYPGDVCASTEHRGHEGLADSQWNQWTMIRDFYRWCRDRGVYLNVPDWYFLSGSSKIGMGYRETNWSLPRARQVVLGRQNIYDGTWAKTPSMGWMFVPLVQYHGGGTEATLEPLSEHLDAYSQHMANNFGAGVQACYRGPRLYDTDETKAMVKGWVDFYKGHRAILESDVIHMRRPDGRDLDAMLHVNPKLEERGFLSVWNPTDEAIQKTLRVPLYYTGLTEKASVSHEGREAIEHTLNRKYEIELEVAVPAQGYAWYLIQ